MNANPKGVVMHDRRTREFVGPVIAFKASYMDTSTLRHDEIVFRVLLQREAARPTLTFATLEASLPKDLRRRVEPDWRSYIRDEGLGFERQ